jgi:hypothetical protein
MIKAYLQSKVPIFPLEAILRGGQDSVEEKRKSIRTTQSSSCLFIAGTSSPCSSAAGHGFESICSITVAIGCVVNRTDQERFPTVSYSIMLPR